MAQKDNKGKDDDERNVNSGTHDDASEGGLHPLEYIEMQENGNLQNYLNPLNEDEEEQGSSGADRMEQQGSGNKGKILTSDGLEYE